MQSTAGTTSVFQQVVGGGASLAAAASGRMGAMQYLFNYELPKIAAWLHVVETRDQTCAALPEEAF